MTIRAIAGLIALNILLAGLGSGVLSALRPGTTRRDLVRLCGVSYLLGAASLMLALTVLIVLSIPVTILTTLLTGIGIVAAARLVQAKRRPEPVSRGARTAPVVSLWSAALVGLLAVVLEAVFRKGRLQGLIEFDGWDSWGPKTKALYHFGHLDPHFLAGLPGGSYPPGLPALLATGLHAIGSDDVVTLHLQYWFLGAGFIAALLGLLTTRVTPLLLLPFVLMIFVMPDIRSRSVDMYGDLPLGFLVATGALLIALWLEEREAWQLSSAAILLAGAALTKREGVILCGCIVLAGLVASADRARRDWPRLLGVLVAAIVATLVWQVWLWGRHLPGNGPSGGLHFLRDGRRGWDSLHVVMNNLFNFDLWLLSLTIAIAAVALCLLVRAWRLGLYFAALITTSVLGCSVILWSDPTLQLTDVNVISRLVGSVALIVVVITPLALQRAWDAGERLQRATITKETRLWQAAVAWTLVAAATITYPVFLLADGGARFPSDGDCSHGPIAGESALIVFGHVGSYSEARKLAARAIAVGANSVETAQDGCGRVRVFEVTESRSESEKLLSRAKAAGLSVKLEAGPST